MKKQIAYVGAMTAALLIWVACDRLLGTKDQNLNLEYLSFTNNGCGGGKLGKTNYADAPCLSKQGMFGDTLILTVHYWANCCAAVRDSVSLHDATADILLADTAETHCRCICGHDNDFSFLFSGSGALRVRFGWIGGPFELDTLIQID